MGTKLTVSIDRSTSKKPDSSEKSPYVFGSDYYVDGKSVSPDIKKLTLTPCELSEYIKKGNTVCFENAICIDVDNIFHSSFSYYGQSELTKEVEEKCTMQKALETLDSVGIKPCLAYQSFNSSPEMEKFHLIIPVDGLDKETKKDINLQLSFLFGYGYDDNLRSAFDKSDEKLKTTLFGTSQEKEVLAYDKAPIYTAKEFLSKLKMANIILREENPEIDKIRLYDAVKNGSHLSHLITKEVVGKLNGEVILPSEITKIVPYAFCRCSKLTSFEFSDTITEIGRNAFDGCENLKAIHIPDSVTDIEIYAFAHSGLTSANIPSNITSIKDGLFYKCQNLSSLEIPDNVTYIGENTFYGCDKLVIHCNPNSYAEQYAKGNNIPVKYIQRNEKAKRKETKANKSDDLEK